MKGPLNLSVRLAFALGAAMPSQPVFAQVLFSSGAYSQRFDTLASSGTPTWSDGSTLPGWYAAKATTPNAFTAYTANTGSGNTGALYSYGSSGSSERALGALVSSGSGNIAFGVRFANDTAQPITGLAVTYTGEQWRAANTSPQTLTFAYRIGSNLTDPDPNNANTWTAVTALNFTSPNNSSANAIDGNQATNRQVFTSIPLTGVQVPAGQEIFLRWYVTKASSGSGDGFGVDDFSITFSGSGTVTNPPTLTSAEQPQSRLNNAGTIASFSVSPDGTAPFAYRWWKNNHLLYDASNITGSATAVLSVSNVLAADAGTYFVVITNSAGAVTSDTAVLTVTDPAILAQPVSQVGYSGDSALFSATAAGTPPLSFQWWKDTAPLSDGGNISGAATSALKISGLTLADQAGYQLVVTNTLGTVNSTAVNLTVRVVPSSRIAFWDFNDTTAPLASPPPAEGAGTASLLNGVTASWATGTSTDPGDVNQAWNTTGYPAATLSNKTAGVQFKVSTLGYTNILVAWEQRNSNTGSKYARLQYSTDGTNFTDANVVSATASFAYYNHDFTGLTAVENNTNFIIRIVSEFESTAANTANNNYVPTSGSSYNGTSGTLRFDTVGVYGEAINPVSSAQLWIKLAGNQAVLTWSNAAFALQSAPALGGVFTNISGASSPYTNSLAARQQFFRLKH